MSYLALARKWRPKKFTEMVGQQHIIKVLCNALENQKVHHAWLFTGTRGVGKTTLARLLTKALNCERGISASPCGECRDCLAIDQGNFIDLLEIDAASKTGVESTRELLENIAYRPTGGRFRVYLIDEIHMFSNASFNALLKTLEEPPAHVKFLLATTEPQKLPVTILSRCLQLKLTRIDAPQIAEHLQTILKAENIPYEPEAITYLSHAADGSVRDSLSLLDQAIALGNNEVKTDLVREMIGLSQDQHLYAATLAIATRDGKALWTSIQAIVRNSSHLDGLLDMWLEYFHQIALYLQIGKHSLTHSRINKKDEIITLAKHFSVEEVHLLYHLLMTSIEDIKKFHSPAHAFEMVAMKLLAFRPKPEIGHQTQNSIEVENTETPMTTEDHKAQLTSPPINETQSLPPPSTDEPKTSEIKNSTTLHSLTPETWLTMLKENQNSLSKSNLVWQHLNLSQFIERNENTLKISLHVDPDDTLKESITDALSQALNTRIDLSIVIQKGALNTLKNESELNLSNSITNTKGFEELDQLMGLTPADQPIKAL